jgi:uncharacterized membrane protein
MVPARASGNPNFAAGILGFALGGFIDGILLHQVLQWHHLLSLVEGEALRDLRVQILADGLFHVLMYLIAIVGLCLLWRARGGITGRGADIRIVASALLGFGIWQVVDVVGFHWVLGIHRIRVDVRNPLFWDIGWLVMFAVPSLAAGWWLMTKPSGDGPSEPTQRRLSRRCPLRRARFCGRAGTGTCWPSNWKDEAPCPSMQMARCWSAHRLSSRAASRGPASSPPDGPSHLFWSAVAAPCIGGVGCPVCVMEYAIAPAMTTTAASPARR